MTYKNEIKRLVIYSFHDKDGIIDDYVLHQLRQLKENSTCIIFTASQKKVNRSRKKLLSIVDDVLMLSNAACAMDMYQESIQSFGKAKLQEYDELVLSSNEMYGPLYPLSEAFNRFSESNVDFWGISRHYKSENDVNGATSFSEYPEHIRDFFLVFHLNVLHSDCFYQFWQSSIDRRIEINSEADNLTAYLEKNGYISDVYVHTEEWKGICVDPLWFETGELIRSSRLPFIDKRIFTGDNQKDITSHTFGEQAGEVLQYIRNKTDYDEGMIWQNAIRCSNMADLHRNARLTRILPTEILTENNSIHKKLLLVIHAYYCDYADFVLRYAERLPSYGDILIVSPLESVIQQYEMMVKKYSFNNKVFFELIPNRGRDVSGLLVGAKKYINNYDLVFFAHDKKTVHVPPLSVGYSWQKKCFENLLCSENYIENIVNLFDSEKNLGMAFPPPPYNASNHYRFLVGWEWSDSYPASEKILKDFGIKSDYSEDKPPIAPFGTMFVFRPKALKKLFAGPKNKGWEYDDFPAEPILVDGTMLHGMERAYPFFVQDAGYYVAWILNETWAANELVNYQIGWSQERIKMHPIVL